MIMQRLVQIKSIYVNDKALPCITSERTCMGLKAGIYTSSFVIVGKISTVVLEVFKSIQNPLVDTGYFWTGQPTVGHG